MAPPGALRGGDASLSAPPPGTDLYRPRPGTGRFLGSAIEKMHREGRREIEAQRMRWQRNRAMFRGEQYLSTGAGGLTRLAPGALLASGRRRDTVNRMRPLVEGRVALLTHQRPPFEVVPPTQDQDVADGARLASKLVRAQWSNVRGWNVERHLYDLALAAEQDGVACSNVLFDRSRGPVAMIPHKLGPRGPEPIASRAEYEALRLQDPGGQRLWASLPGPGGEVVFRVVRLGWMMVDPNMTSDWADARYAGESRVRPIADVEAETGQRVGDLMERSNELLGRRPGGPAQPVMVETQAGPDAKYDPTEQVLVHSLYVKATGQGGEWPRGAHVMWLHPAPGVPILAEPWVDQAGAPLDLPYYPYVPRPDGLHLIRSIGTVEELAPIQVAYNRTHSQINEWMDLIARPPLLLHGGSLRSASVFNEKRLVVVNPGFSDPRFMAVPIVNAGALDARLERLEREMEEIAVQSKASRGQAPGQGIEAAAALNLLVQQDEQQLSGTAGRFKEAIEWAVSEALRLVGEHYSLARTVAAPGVEDEEEFRAFTGEKLRGATRFVVTGSLLPRSRAAQIQMLNQFLAVAGPRFDPTPFAADIIEGDVERIVSMEKAQSRRQENENRIMARLGAHADVELIWREFTTMRDEYARALAGVSQMLLIRPGQTGAPPELDPTAFLARAGVQPPRASDLMRRSGTEVPMVEDTDRDAAHIKAIEFFCASDAWPRLHPFVRQLVREHNADHRGKIARNVAAMARQQETPPGPPQGSPPAAKGEAPQPKQPAEEE